MIFDCPGQLELFTFDQAFKNIVSTLTDKWHYRQAPYVLWLLYFVVHFSGFAIRPESCCAYVLTWHDHSCALDLYRLAAVNLVDAQLCTDAGKYVAALLTSLSTMLHLELPHVNLLSKADLIMSYGELDFDLSFYLEV